MVVIEEGFMLLIAHKLAYLRVGDWQCSIEEDHQSLVVWWSAADARNGGDARDNGIILQSQVGDVEVSFGINERSLDLLDLHSIVVGTTLSSRKECVQKVGSAYPIVIVVIEDGSTQTIRQSIDNKAIELLVISVPRRQSRFGLTDCSRVGDSDVTTWRAGGTDWRRHNRLGLLAG